MYVVHNWAEVDGMIVGWMYLNLFRNSTEEYNYLTLILSCKRLH